jgi:hypothetical protein
MTTALSPAQQDVDHDDLADGDPELGGQQHVHGAVPAAGRAVWVWGSV